MPPPGFSHPLCFFLDPPSVVFPPPRFFSKPSLKNRNTVFTLGNRGAVIGAAELEGPIIVPHAAQKSDVRVSYTPRGGS